MMVTILWLLKFVVGHCLGWNLSMVTPPLLAGISGLAPGSSWPVNLLLISQYFANLFRTSLLAFWFPAQISSSVR